MVMMACGESACSGPSELPSEPRPPPRPLLTVEVGGSGGSSDDIDDVDVDDGGGGVAPGSKCVAPAVAAGLLVVAVGEVALVEEVEEVAVVELVPAAAGGAFGDSGCAGRC